MWLLRNIKVLLFSIAMLGCLSVQAEEKVESSFYFGVGGGYHLSHMSVSNLDKTIFPNSKNQGSGVFDFFLQYEFGKKKQFGVRLEVDFLKRGGKLDGIGNFYDEAGLVSFYESEGISDISYKLRSSYIDLRLPIIYQFCDARSVLRPYVYIAPMVCFSTGGHIDAQIDYMNGAYEGSRLDITKGNMRPAYFAGAIGAGLKYDLNLYGHPFYLSLEANYQMGFTNTYSSKEKSGSAVVKDDIFFNVYDITGSRRFNGFEVKGSLSIPLSIFSKKKQPVVVDEVYEPVYAEPVVVKEEVVEVAEEVPCRTIQEITTMIEKGENVHGVSFCSIDDIRFETGKSTLLGSSYDYLNQLASILKENGMHVEVLGHTDNVGTHDFNMKLSKNRALSVVNYLKKAGVPKNQLSYSYYGETRPIRDNSTEAGRSVNRRVEFEIK